MTTPAFRSVGTPSAASGATVSPGKPTGLADGDVMVACLVQTAGVAELGQTTGWTLIGKSDVGTSHSVQVFAKGVASAAGEPATYDFTGGAGTVIGQIAAFQYADTVDLNDVTTLGLWNSGGTTGTGITSASVATEHANALVLVVWGVNDDTANSTGYTNAALTEINERIDQTSTSGNPDGALSMWEGIRAAAGTVGTGSGTVATSETNRASVTFALREYVAATPKSGSDTGTGTDAAPAPGVAHAQAQTGAGTDASALDRPVAGADTGTGADPATGPAAAAAQADAGSGTDAHELDQGTTDKEGADTATGTDDATVYAPPTAGPLTVWRSD